MELTLRAMRGTDTKQSSMLALMSPESVVPSTHPLRRVKVLADAVLTKLSPTFDAMYSAIGRPSIPPERLLKSMVLMALYSVRSERLLCGCLLGTTLSGDISANIDDCLVSVLSSRAT